MPFCALIVAGEVTLTRQLPENFDPVPIKQNGKGDWRSVVDGVDPVLGVDETYNGFTYAVAATVTRTRAVRPMTVEEINDAADTAERNVLIVEVATLDLTGNNLSASDQRAINHLVQHLLT